MISWWGCEGRHWPIHGWQRQDDWLWLAALLLIAALLRLPQLETVPPGFQFDETYNAWDALRVAEGARPVFLPANAGREPLYTYLQSLLVARKGPTPVAARLTSALPGIVTVLLLYGFVRLLFPYEGTELAGLAALCLALSYWHLHFSRYGIRSILIPFWGLPTLASLWLGLRRRGVAWFGVCGLGLAAMIWTHPVGRLMPFAVVIVILYAAWIDRQRAWHYVIGLLVGGLVTTLLVLPLGWYFWQHPDQFLGHTSDVSIFDPRVHQGSLPRALTLNIIKVVGMFTCIGDGEWLHNLPGRPVFDPLMGMSFIMGLVIYVRRLVRREDEPLRRVSLTLIGVWLVILLTPSILSDLAPNFSRTIGAAPIVMLLAAWGLRAGWQWLEGKRHPHLARVVIVVVMVISGSWASWDYFVRFARHPLAYYHYDQDKMDVADFLHQESEENALYLAPLWAQHPTVSLLTRDIDLRSVETNAALVFPARQGESGILYSFPPEQEHNATELEREWGTWGQRDELQDPQGEVLLHLFRIPAAHRPTVGEGMAFVAETGFPPGALEGEPFQFGQSIGLLGYEVPVGFSLEQESSVIILWEALDPIDRNYTAFVHLIDERNQRWGQADNWPGEGSFPTTNWRVGDVILDRYQVNIDPCLPPGRYWLEVGWYDLVSGERLRTSKGGVAGRLGTIEIESAPSADRAELSPSSRTSYWLSNDIHLFGFDLPETDLEVGRPFPLTLYWEAARETRGRTAFLIRLKDTHGHVVEVATSEAGVGSDSVWMPERVSCQTLQLRLEDVPEGSYQLQLQAKGRPNQAADIAEVTIVPSTRHYVAPPIAIPVHEDLGDTIRLLGCNLSGVATGPDGSIVIDAESTIHMNLYWQMLHRVETSYTVFTHLIGEDGQLRAQKDNIPVEGAYPTTEWVEGEVVEDSYQILVPDDVPSGSYWIEVGLYDASNGKRLPLTKDREVVGGDRILLPIQVIAH